MTSYIEQNLLESWNFNSGALLIEIFVWRQQYIAKQRCKNPEISDTELINKIKNAKYRKFKDRAYFLLDSHPVIIKLQSVYD